MTDPVTPIDRTARLASTITAGIGALLLLAALGTILWALAIVSGPSQGNHFGLSGLGVILALGFAGVALVVLPFALHYLNSGLRARRTGVADLGTTAAISCTIAIVALTIALNGRWSDMSLIAAIIATIFGLHGLLLFAIGRGEPLPAAHDQQSPPATTDAPTPRPFD